MAGAKYGLPYLGSKSAIADWAVEHLPRAGTLVDLFCGGCAVTHAAMLSGKWEHFIANDIHGDVPQLFLDAIEGKYTTENQTRWISREEFHARKDEDAYIRLCWSFKNDGCTYMYGANIETPKHLLHNIVFGSSAKERMLAWRAMRRYLLGLSEDERQDALNALGASDKGNELPTLRRLQSLQSLQSLERLERLERLQSLQRLETSGKDYHEVEIPPESVVYCDIPYGNADRRCYNVTFDRQAFFDWACAQTVPIIVSEYNIADDRFEVLVETSKKQLSAGAAHQKTVTERLYAPKHQIAEIRRRLDAEKDEQIRLEV